MKRYLCKVQRTDEYIVELDESVLDEEWMKGYREYFADLHDLEEHAENIAQYRARFGERYIEGYGVPLNDGKKPWFANDKEVNRAINIKIISEDSECEVDVSEMKS
ncbi:hypothetical protein EBB07_28360 [Paenibacillaceae bacterium]|nr:hypothetical protein EBB07_28360 [Paenibacillaceae bacterium]